MSVGLPSGWQTRTIARSPDFALVHASYRHNAALKDSGKEIQCCCYSSYRLLDLDRARSVSSARMLREALSMRSDEAKELELVSLPV